MLTGKRPFILIPPVYRKGMDMLERRLQEARVHAKRRKVAGFYRDFLMPGCGISPEKRRQQKENL